MKYLLNEIGLLFDTYADLYHETDSDDAETFSELETLVESAEVTNSPADRVAIAERLTSAIEELIQ